MQLLVRLASARPIFVRMWTDLLMPILLIQTRQNTLELNRAESNATQTAASVFRMAIVNSKDVARVAIAGMTDEGELDRIDVLRFLTLVDEITWFSVLIWQRQRIGLIPRGQWERNYSVLGILLTRRGAVWWDQNKASFPPGFAEDVDNAIAAQQIRTLSLGITRYQPSGDSAAM